MNYKQLTLLLVFCISIVVTVGCIENVEWSQHTYNGEIVDVIFEGSKPTTLDPLYAVNPAFILDSEGQEKTIVKLGNGNILEFKDNHYYEIQKSKNATIHYSENNLVDYQFFKSITYEK